MLGWLILAENLYSLSERMSRRTEELTGSTALVAMSLAPPRGRLYFTGGIMLGELSREPLNVLRREPTDSTELSRREFIKDIKF